MCSDVSGSFSLCFWRDLSLVKGAAEVTSQCEIPQEVMGQLQEGAARCCLEQAASAPGRGAAHSPSELSQVTGGRSCGSRGSQSKFSCSRAVVIQQSLGQSSKLSSAQAGGRFQSKTPLLTESYPAQAARRTILCFGSGKPLPLSAPGRARCCHPLCPLTSPPNAHLWPVPCAQLPQSDFVLGLDTVSRCFWAFPLLCWVCAQPGRRLLPQPLVHADHSGAAGNG